MDKFKIVATPSIGPMASNAIDMAMIDRKTLEYEDVVSCFSFTGSEWNQVIFAMVVRSNGKYYCFNYYPARKGVALVYTLDRCDDMWVQVKASLESLGRLLND